MLKEVLLALSNAIPDVGYIQGLNSVAAALILKLLQMAGFGEDKDYPKIKEISYWVVKYLMVKMDLRLLYEREFRLYTLLCFQFDLLIEFYMPEVKAVMDTHDYQTSTFTCEWFLTIYSNVVYFFLN